MLPELMAYVSFVNGDTLDSPSPLEEDFRAVDKTATVNRALTRVVDRNAPASVASRSRGGGLKFNYLSIAASTGESFARFFGFGLSSSASTKASHPHPDLAHFPSGLPFKPVMCLPLLCPQTQSFGGVSFSTP